MALYDTDEVLWYANGKWGECGYAIPNPGGKTFTNNPVIGQFVSLVGRVMFDLTHREDAKFYRPPHKQWWYDLHQMLVTGRKRLHDFTRAPNDNNGLTLEHATPTPAAFIVYPVPHFRERIRQPDIRFFNYLSLLMLTEAMQHSDNEHASYITPEFSGRMGKFLQEMLAQLAMKYFGKSRTDAYKSDFKLTDADFQGYDPASVMTSVELTEERPPLQWWPTENDLSGIRALPINSALLFSKRWPDTNWLVSADGAVTVSHPGDGASGAGVAVAAGAFVAPPGQAP